MESFELIDELDVVRETHLARARLFVGIVSMEHFGQMCPALDVSQGAFRQNDVYLDVALDYIQQACEALEAVGKGFTAQREQEKAAMPTGVGGYPALIQDMVSRVTAQGRYKGFI